MKIIILVIITFIVMFFLSMKKNNKKCIETSEMDILEFEKRIREVLQRFTMNYSEVCKSRKKYEYIFDSSFEIKFNIEFEKFTEVMEAKVTTYLEENNLMLRINERKKNFLKDGIKYTIPFYKSGYTLEIVMFKLKKDKLYKVTITVVDEEELELSKISKKIDELEEERVKTINSDKEIKLINEIESFIKTYGMPVIDSEVKEEIFLHKTSIIKKVELENYFEHYENRGLLKKGIPYEIKSHMFTEKYVMRLVEFLSKIGYEIDENNLEIENQEKYFIYVDDWSTCIITEKILKDRIIIELEVKKG